MFTSHQNIVHVSQHNMSYSKLLPLVHSIANIPL
jgi:hypothetical protein